MENELAALRRENERLNMFVALLVEKVNTLQQQLTYLSASGGSENNLDLSNDKTGNGLNNLNSSNDKNMDGVNKVFISNDKTWNRGNYVPEAVTENRNTSFTPDYNLVRNRLKAIMGKCSDMSIGNTAQMLIQMYMNRRNSHKTLRKITGLSVGGLTKRIMALKRDGYIVRTGFQQYELTAKSRKAVEG